MPQRYFIHFAYDGANYAGWQRQPHCMTVQQRLEEALAVLLRHEVSITGAGRTDTGVHARKMAAHFDCEPIDFADNLAYKLNRLLPSDIVVHSVESVSNDLHARFSAVSRTYRYFVNLNADPFLRNYSLQLYQAVDFERMNNAAQLLLHTQDFAAFAKLHSDVKTTICKVTQAQWIKQNDNSYYFQITANRFLRNMVRAIVGTLLDVGRGKLTHEQFQHIVDGRNRMKAGDSAPAHALFLWDIEYPTQCPAIGKEPQPTPEGAAQ